VKGDPNPWKFEVQGDGNGGHARRVFAVDFEFKDKFRIGASRREQADASIVARALGKSEDAQRGRSR